MGPQVSFISLGLIKTFTSLDFKISRQYPSRIIFSFFQVLMMVFLFFYISETLGEIAVLKTKYFPFVATGLAFQHFFSGIVNASSQKLEEYRDYGVLEEILFSQHTPWSVIISSGFYNVVLSAMKSLVLMLSVFIVFDAQLNFSLLFTALFLMFFLGLQLAFISSCSFLIWKRFSLLEIGGSIVTLLLSGIYFPVNILPKPIALLAYSNPLMHGLVLFRRSIGLSNGHDDLFATNQSILIISVAIALALGFNVFLYKKTLEHTQRKGLANHF